MGRVLLSYRALSLETDGPAVLRVLVLPEFQGYDLIIGRWAVIKGHLAKSLIRNALNGLRDFLRFGGLDKVLVVRRQE